MSLWKDIDCYKCIYRVRDSRLNKQGEPYIKRGALYEFWCLVGGRRTKTAGGKAIDCKVFEKGDSLITRIKKLEKGL